MRQLVCIALCVAAASCAGMQKPETHPSPACPPPAADPALSVHLLQSRVVVVGVPEADAQKLAAEAAKDRPDYLAIPVKVAEVIKGEAPTTLSVMHYARDVAYLPTNAALSAHSGQNSLMFLVESSSATGQSQFYFGRPDSLGDARPEAVVALKSELARQGNILKSWSRDQNLPHYREVGALIGSLASIKAGPGARDAQQAIFQQIEALGEASVPAIVAQLDDRRALAEQQISLVNHSTNAFEGVRHYVVYSIGDALTAILNQITGAYFDSYNRLTDASLAGWRIYATDLVCKGA